MLLKHKTSRIFGDSRMPSLDIVRLSSQTLTPSQIPPIGAERIADPGIELDKECIIERSRVVSIAPARMPFIGQSGRYNKRWYCDIVNLPNNAMRLFIAKLFQLITAVHRLALDMTTEDFELAFGYVAEFDRFLRVMLEAEEKILYPECEKDLKKRPDYETSKLHPDNRKEIKEIIYKLLSNITDDSLKEVPAMNVAKILQQNADELSGQILEYFAAKERDIPRIFQKSTRGAKEKNRMEGRLIRFFDDLGKEMYYSAMLIMPLGAQDVREEFAERHFTKSKREMLRSEAKFIKETLFSIPSAFDDAAHKYESRFSVHKFMKHYRNDKDSDVLTEMTE